MKSRRIVPALLLALLALPACHSSVSESGIQPDSANSVRVVGTDPGEVGAGTPLTPRKGDQLAAFAGGCFWGTEDVFRHVPGVVATAVGYTGGHTIYPTYEDVSSHTTGHAESVLVEFNPREISYKELLNVFFKNHDPTTLDRQGPDVGSNYRSAIFTFNPQQAEEARAAKAAEQRAARQDGRDRNQPHRSFLEGRGLPPAIRREDRHALLSAAEGTAPQA